MTLKPFTKQTLYEEWDSQYNDLKNRIKKLKMKLEQAETDEKINQYEYEINILCERKSLIHEFLADVGMLIER